MRYLLFDFETTSAEPSTTRAVQLAAACVTGSQIELVTNTICNPEVDIHHGATQVHGISNEMVADKEVDWKVVTRFATEHLRAGDEVTLAGHNSRSFDEPILRRLARMGGYEIPIFPHIDTLVLSTRLWPLAPTHKLSQTAEEAEAAGTPGKLGLTQYLGLGTGAGAHDALADVMMVWELIQRASAEQNASLADLAAYCDRPAVLQVCHLGKHKGKRWGDGPKETHVPRWYCQGMTNWMKDPSPDIQATLLYHYNIKFPGPNRLRCLEGIV